MSLENSVDKELKRRKAKERRAHKERNRRKQVEQERKKKDLRVMEKYLRASGAPELLEEANEKYLGSRGEVETRVGIYEFVEERHVDDWSRPKKVKVTKPVADTKLTWKVPQEDKDAKECSIKVAVETLVGLKGRSVYVKFKSEGYLVNVMESRDIEFRPSKPGDTDDQFKDEVRESVAFRVAGHIEKGNIKVDKDHD